MPLCRYPHAPTQILNLSNNRLTKVENLACVPKLAALQLAHNMLRTAADLEHLRECTTIQ